MIYWREKDEGQFQSSFFCNDENQKELFVYIQNPDMVETAEKCVEAFNSLPQDTITEICKEIIVCAEQGGIAEDFELPELEKPTDILEYCWFIALYALGENSYIVEGEGDWGEVIGFVIKNGRLIYTGVDYTDYMK